MKPLTTSARLRPNWPLRAGSSHAVVGWLRRAAAAALLLAAPGSLLAQDAGGGTTVTVTYYWLDSILVGALCAAALFAICKSSRRS